jgi:hypothetical protein
VQKKAFDSSVDGFLKVVYPDTILIDCKILYPHTQICSSTSIINEQTKKEISEEVEKCYNSDKINIILPALANSARSNQGVEFFYNNAVYHIGKDGVEKVATPLTDAQINSGDWTTADDVKIRYEINDTGVIQYKAIGIRSNLVLAEGKTAKLAEVSAHIKTKGNAFFAEYNVTQPELTPAKLGKNLNDDNETFADGKKMAIDNNASFIKISCEGLGLLTTLAKTAEIEKPAYLESTENKTTIHAPGMVTGSIEAGAKLYTDITGVVIMVYDVSVDKKARTDAYTGLVKIKNEVKQEPTKLFPMFFDIIVQEASGNTPADWGEIKDDKTDTGRKGHLYTKGVVRTTLTIVASGPLLAKLPKMAEDLAKKMDNVLEQGLSETGDQIKDAIKKKLTEIEKYFSTEEFLKRIDDRFSKYKGLLTKDEWIKRYKTLYKNREIGKLTEEEFQLLEGGLKPKKGITTSDGKRYFDNVLDETAREVKSGPITLTNSKQQILKDIEIIKQDLTQGQIKKIEWHCFEEVEKETIENFIKVSLKDKSNLFEIIKH